MSSTNKTSLGLNMWEASDKPVRQDFVNDNVIIDEKITKLNSDLALKADKNELSNIKIQAIGSTVSYNGASYDANKLEGFLSLGSGSNYPDKNFWYIIHMTYNATNKKQIAYEYKGNGTKTRFCDNGSWSNWV